jgi:hypothetical protein
MDQLPKYTPAVSIVSLPLDTTVNADPHYHLQFSNTFGLAEERLKNPIRAKRNIHGVVGGRVLYKAARVMEEK